MWLFTEKGILDIKEKWKQGKNVLCVLCSVLCVCLRGIHEHFEIQFSLGKSQRDDLSSVTIKEKVIFEEVISVLLIKLRLIKISGGLLCHT